MIITRIELYLNYVYKKKCIENVFIYYYNNTSFLIIRKKIIFIIINIMNYFSIAQMNVKK